MIKKLWDKQVNKNIGEKNRQNKQQNYSEKIKNSHRMIKTIAKTSYKKSSCAN